MGQNKSDNILDKLSLPFLKSVSVFITPFIEYIYIYTHMSL